MKVCAIEALSETQLEEKRRALLASVGRSQER